MWVQKWSKMIFSKIVPRLLCVLKQVVSGYLELCLTHINRCKFPTTLEMGSVRTGSAYGWVVLWDAIDCVGHPCADTILMKGIIFNLFLHNRHPSMPHQSVPVLG